MKDMNQTILEIRRRGHQRLRMRKRIVRQLTGVCCAAAVWAAAIWAIPKGTPVSLDIAQTACPAETQMYDAVLTIPEVRTASVRITGNGLDSYIEDPAFAAALQDWIAGQKEMYNTASSYTADASVTNESTEDRKENPVIRVRIESEGACTEYLLSESVLRQVDGNHVYPLTESQYRELLMLLRIPG